MTRWERGSTARSMAVFYDIKHTCNFKRPYFWVSVGTWERVSLCSLGWLWTQNPPASAFQVLGLQACTTTPALSFYS
jgi:hypothetical protein